MRENINNYVGKTGLGSETVPGDPDYPDIITEQALLDGMNTEDAELDGLMTDITGGGDLRGESMQRLLNLGQ